MKRFAIRDVKDKLDTFLEGPYYLMALGLAVFLFWALELQYAGMATLVVVACALLLTGKCGKPFVSLVVLFVMCVSDIWHFDATFWIFVAVLASVLGVCLLYRFVLLLRCPKSLTPGKLCGGLLVAFLVTMLGGAGYGYSLIGFFQTLGLCFAGFAFYFFFVNTLKAPLTRYVAQLALVSAAVVLAEILAYYFKIYAVNWDIADVLASFQFKDIDLAWARSNTAAVMLMMAIPFSLYLSTETKRNYLYILYAFVCALGVLFTFSRANLLFLVLTIVPIMVYTFVKTKYKLNYLYVSIAILLFVVGVAILFRRQLETVFRFLLEAGFNSHGRIERFIVGIRYFLQAPLFGTGIFTIPDVELAGPWFMVHCTTIQLMMNFGIIGMLGYGYFFFQRYALFFRKRTKYKVFAFFAVLLAELHGMLDVTFYVIFYVFYIFVFSVAAEREEAEEAGPDTAKEKTVLNQAAAGIE